MWSRHSRRIVPISLSTYGFCHGDRGAVGLSRMPMAPNRCLKIGPYAVSPLQDLLYFVRDPWPWGKPHEAAGIHRTSRQRYSRVAARGARAATSKGGASWLSRARPSPSIMEFLHRAAMAGMVVASSSTAADTLRTHRIPAALAMEARARLSQHARAKAS